MADQEDVHTLKSTLRAEVQRLKEQVQADPEAAVDTLDFGALEALAESPDTVVNTVRDVVATDDPSLATEGTVSPQVIGATADSPYVDDEDRDANRVEPVLADDPSLGTTEATPNTDPASADSSQGGPDAEVPVAATSENTNPGLNAAAGEPAAGDPPQAGQGMPAPGQK